MVLSALTRAFESGGERVLALENVSLSVAFSETVAVTGPSGSGKTSLLNIVAGLDRPTSGTVTVMGQELTGLKERELTAFRAHSLGIVFQDPHLLPGLTALENVIAARLPWARRRVLEPEARKLLKAVGLGSRMNLDAGSTEELLNLLDELRSDLGLTLVVVTHDPAVAAIAQRVVRLSGGRVVEDRRQPAADRIYVREVE